MSLLDRFSRAPGRPAPFAAFTAAVAQLRQLRDVPQALLTIAEILCNELRDGRTRCLEHFTAQGTDHALLHLLPLYDIRPFFAAVLPVLPPEYLRTDFFATFWRSIRASQPREAEAWATGRGMASPRPGDGVENADFAHIATLFAMQCHAYRFFNREFAEYLRTRIISALATREEPAVIDQESAPATGEFSVPQITQASHTANMLLAAAHPLLSIDGYSAVLAPAIPSLIKVLDFMQSSSYLPSQSLFGATNKISEIKSKALPAAPHAKLFGALLGFVCRIEEGHATPAVPLATVALAASPLLVAAFPHASSASAQLRLVRALLPAPTLLRSCITQNYMACAHLFAGIHLPEVEWSPSAVYKLLLQGVAASPDYKESAERKLLKQAEAEETAGKNRLSPLNDVSASSEFIAMHWPEVLIDLCESPALRCPVVLEFLCKSNQSLGIAVAARLLRELHGEDAAAAATAVRAGLLRS